jgi:hypothetical protein
MPARQRREFTPEFRHSGLLTAGIIHIFEDYGYDFMQKTAAKLHAALKQRRRSAL